MKTLLISFTDSGNYGDQLIVEQLAQRLSKYGELVTYSYSMQRDLEPRVFESPPKNEGLKSKIKSFYSKFIRKKKFFDWLHGIIMVENQKRKLNNSNFSEDLRSTDLLVIGGGNTIFDLTPCSKSAKKFEVIIDLAKKNKKKIYFMDVGIGPFITDEQLGNAKDVLRKSDYITVRDKASYALLSDVDNVQLGIDPVFFYETEIAKTQEKSRVIGMSIIDLRLNKSTEDSFFRYLTMSKSLILEILKQNPDYKIVLYNSEYRDYIAITELLKILPNQQNIVARFIGSKSELVQLTKTFDLLIGTRMHSMILAVSQDIPIIGLSWQPKVTEVFNILEDSNSVFNIDEIEKRQFDIINKISEKLKKTNKNDMLIEKLKAVEYIDIENLIGIVKELES